MSTISPVRTTDILALGFNPGRLETRNKKQETRARDREREPKINVAISSIPLMRFIKFN
ncbi:hypothetical protein ACFOUP_13830 [Belliella kenyensis]|uniref:Uncharacterized protein n=1 Tax=Belliella kenyensis TaxID=1472724 RepID=A0ABV8ENI0_9BACT|nr:hypothetical protein [Belliella kenyensis]MCH7401522.1 hypothetical protein [Belliella kenyensis]